MNAPTSGWATRLADRQTLISPQTANSVSDLASTRARMLPMIEGDVANVPERCLRDAAEKPIHER